VLSKLFTALEEVPVRMVSYGGSAHNISILIPADQKNKTLQLLNKGIFGID
jgi:aspartate kinase